MENNFRVVVRVRPPLPRELPDKKERDDQGNQLEFLPITSIGKFIKEDRTQYLLTVEEYLGSETTEKGRQFDLENNQKLFAHHQFSYDKIYGPDDSQIDVYEETARPAVLSVLLGYNATILAYGQTGTGKTYTMEGFKYSSVDEQRGIIPRAMEEIFKYISSEDQ